MKENKRAICEALLPVLQMTRAMDDLTDLEYSGVLPYGSEYVTALFKQGRKTVNVTGGSGIAIIIEITRSLI